MNEHPLIAAMRTAGSATKRQAESLLSPYYDPYGFDAASRLAGALVEDQTGASVIADQQKANDRDASVESRRAAGERSDLRATIAKSIHNLPYEYRDRLYRELSTGNGAIEADALLQSIEAGARDLIMTIGSMSRTVAVAS